jgi:23S rRNA pseudouridine2605 synthase
VRVHGIVDPLRLAALEKGVTIDGIAYGSIRAQLERQQGSNAWVAMGLREGKNREVRRVLEHLGYPVTRLIRLSYGPFQLGGLARGAIEEVQKKVLEEQLGRGEPDKKNHAPKQHAPKQHAHRRRQASRP